MTVNFSATTNTHLALMPTSECRSHVPSSSVLASLKASDMRKQKLDLQLKNFVERKLISCNRLQLSTPDGVVLDAMEMRNSASPIGKWILWFNGNGEFFEENLGQAYELGNQIGANSLVFNYRGVGRSGGSPKTINDLIVDGDTCMQYLIEKAGATSQDILFIARSLGGGVGAFVRATYPDGGIISDRSFSSWAEVMQARNDQERADKLKKWNWDIDTLKVWDKILGPKVVMYHKNDPVVPYASSLHNAIKGAEPLSIERTLEMPMIANPHNIPIIFDKLNEIIAISKDILKIQL